MATSESEPDFESADEESNNSRRGNNNTAIITNTTKRRTTIGSDSDDDEDFIPSPKQQNLKKMDSAKKNQHKKSSTTKKKTPTKPKNDEKPSEDKTLKQELQESEEKTKTEQTDRSPEVPDEMKSNLKFKDIFKPDGWEGLDDDVELPDSLSDDKYHPVLDKLASAAGNRTPDDVVDSWSTWGSWGVSSLINTATAGVSTVTSQVSRGLTLLEETMGIQDPEELAQAVSAEEAKNSDNAESQKTDSDKKLTTEEEEEKSESNNSVVSFGFGNFLKLVETTSSRVISGGLDTLETIGKKTMEVLQDGDPGLKKKRAFFFEEGEKPILSQVLREAKEKADVEEKSAEEKQMARKVHFESIFDDFQGLVHLEALEMLSKQCNMKIQQKLVDLEGDELNSLEETLDEIKELCDLGDEDEEEEAKRSFEDRLNDACQDLGIPVTFEKIVNVWNEIESNIPDPTSKDVSHLKIFQNAILAIAQFTALSVEQFHKSAELLLVKERRSTVNETDALVQMTKILCHQVGQVANLFCTCLNRIKDESEKGIISRNITTTLVEATNASSYIQEGFRLLIPILQVGAI